MHDRARREDRSRSSYTSSTSGGSSRGRSNDRYKSNRPWCWTCRRGSCRCTGDASRNHNSSPGNRRNLQYRLVPKVPDSPPNDSSADGPVLLDRLGPRVHAVEKKVETRQTTKAASGSETPTATRRSGSPPTKMATVRKSGSPPPKIAHT